jgi:hypothetical protein
MASGNELLTGSTQALTFLSIQIGSQMKLRHMLIGASLLMSSLSGMSQSVNDCDMKKIKDEQLLCTATSMMNSVMCEQISTNDGRHYCRAMVQSNSHGCDGITSPVKRQYCLMAVRDKQRSANWAIR